MTDRLSQIREHHPHCDKELKETLDKLPGAGTSYPCDLCWLISEVTKLRVTITGLESPVEEPETDEERKDKWRKDRHEHRIRDIDKALAEKGWVIAYDLQPPYDQIVSVLMSDGTEGLAMYNTNYDRTCWLVKGFIGQYWRSMMGPFVTHWRELKEETDGDETKKES